MRLGLVLALLLFTDAANGQSARLTVTQDSVRVGEPFRVTLTLAHDKAAQAWFPDTLAHPAMSTRSRSEPRTTSESGVFREDAVTYEIALFALDSLEIPPLPAGSITGRDTAWAFSAPVTVYVRSVLPDSGASELRPPLPPEPFAYPLWVWLTLFGAILGLAAFLLLAALRARRTRGGAEFFPAPSTATPQDLLAALAHLDLRDREAVQLAYDRLSTALRVHLEPHVGTPTDRVTSRELLALVQRVPPLKALHAPLSDVLRALDLVRFAGVLPSSERHRASISSAGAVFSSLPHDPPPAPDLPSA